jgi:glycosyltransferase involved in cell wall biosynthesis
MRVGFDAKRAFANKTGLGNYSRFVLEALTNFKSSNEYLAFTPKNNQNLFPGFPENQIRTPQTYLDKKLPAYWRYASVTSQLKQENVSLFHGLSNELPQGLRQAGIKSVVTIHDLIFERLPEYYRPLDRLIYRHKFQSACERADTIIAVSEQTKRDLIELYRIKSDKIRVVYQDCNPVFKQHIDLSQRAQILEHYHIDAPYILSVGTLEERKNQHRLVEAFAGLKNHKFKLVLVGKPTGYLEKIKDTIRHFNLEDQVMILQNVPTEHLPALYQSAEIAAYISIYEGFGIPVLEALHSGTPVLAAKGSCLEEAGGAGGLYADSYKIEDIGNQLQKLVADVSLRKSLVSAGQVHIQQFAGANIARQLVNIYEEIS